MREKGSFVFKKTTSCRQRIDVSQQLIKCVSNLYPFKRIWRNKEKEDISNHLMYNGCDVFSSNLISFEFFLKQDTLYRPKTKRSITIKQQQLQDIKLFVI
jgi:hypothetical protein